MAGLYTAVTAWGAVGWISVTLASLLVMMAFGAYNGLNLALLEQDLTSERSSLAPGRLAQTRNSLLLASAHGRAGILLGVLVLMKFKPDLISSVLNIDVAVLLGLLSVLRPCWRVGRRPRAFTRRRVMRPRLQALSSGY